MLTLNTPARVNTSPPATPIRKTAATFSPNATPAFDSMTNGPIRVSSRKGARPSVKGRKQALMIAHTCMQSVALSKGGFLKNGAYRSVVMKRAKGVHLTESDRSACTLVISL